MATAASKKINKLRSLIMVTIGGGVVYSGLSIYRGNQRFYNNVVMPTMKMLPAETSHKLAVMACKYKFFKTQEESPENLETVFFDRVISNPIGIAAGFDKHGEAVEGLQRLGFGFVEIGSVTPEPQPGNDAPRVFRLFDDKAIINRYGFNSDGHDVVYNRLKDIQNNEKVNVVLGVNLGKNKFSESAIDDYVKGVEKFGPIADYLVINVSSPNTPGLRLLQGKNELVKLLEAVLEARSQLIEGKKVPILLKLSPDLSKQDIKDVIAVINKKSCHIDGLIVSNTTVERGELKEFELAVEVGGLSGAPLRSKSTQMIADIYKETRGEIPIIGVGGIFTGRDAFEKLEAGASFIQFYTAFIYHGPPVVQRIKSELAYLVTSNGYDNVQDVVGRNYQKYLSE